MSDESAAALLAQMDAEQRHLRDLLAGVDDATLAERPPNGKWSVLENVRHLLFAEQLHLGRLAPGDQPFSPLGLTPHNMSGPKFRAVGTTPPSSAREVLDAWDATRTATRALADKDTDEVRKALTRNLRHLRAHTKVIERLLRPRP